MSLRKSIQVSQTEAPECSQQKETVFVLGCSSGAPRTESTVLWPFSKRDHLSPKLGLATPALAAIWRQKGTSRVDVAQQASRINHHLFPSAHIPPLSLPSSMPLSQLPPHQRQPAGREQSLRERLREMVRRALTSCKRKTVKRVRSSDRKLWEHPCLCYSAEVSQSPYCHIITEEQHSKRVR